MFFCAPLGTQFKYPCQYVKTILGCTFIKPNYNFSTTCKSKDLYLTDDDFNQSFCKRDSDSLICPEIYFLHPSSILPICDVIYDKILEKFQIVAKYGMSN